MVFQRSAKSRAIPNITQLYISEAQKTPWGRTPELSPTFMGEIPRG